MKQFNLSYEERYQLGYLRGYRIGRIETTREILIKCLHRKCKEQNVVLDKKLVQKINREIDIEFLGSILLCIGNDIITVKELEKCYDMLFLLPSKDEQKKRLWRWPFINKGDIILNELLGDE